MNSSLPPPHPTQVRILWGTLTALAIAVLLGLIVGAVWGAGQVLDVLSPAKNPDMWQDSLFQQMALLSNNHTSFATFTSASAVRRQLMAAGFQVNKQAGYAKKREMLYGQYLGASHAA